MGLLAGLSSVGFLLMSGNDVAKLGTFGAGLGLGNGVSFRLFPSGIRGKMTLELGSGSLDPKLLRRRRRR